jgi:RNA 2',3'-cyclic 3'-phosphodiesterase
MKLRLFIGITAPPEWKAALTEWRRKIQAQFSDSFGRWTAESNLHLTLRFFGSVEETEVLAIAKKVQAIATVSEQLSLTPGPFGCFPSNSRPCILWLGFKGATDGLIQLESDIRSATAQFGQPPEDRPFHPHLTLARLKEPTRRDRDFISELIRKPTPIEVPVWQIHGLELIRGQPGPAGSVYTTLATMPLK